MVDSKENPALNNAPKRGRPFEKGNPGGPGRPKNTHAEKLKEALALAIDEKDIQQIAKGLIRSAMRGQAPAAKELFDRLWGKAPQDVRVGNTDEEKFEVGVSESILKLVAGAVLKSGGGKK